MFIDRETREKLDILSLKVYGARSFWCDMVRKGVPVSVRDADDKHLHNKVTWFTTPEELIEFIEIRAAQIDAANKVSDETTKS